MRADPPLRPRAPGPAAVVTPGEKPCTHPLGRRRVARWPSSSPLPPWSRSRSVPAPPPQPTRRRSPRWSTAPSPAGRRSTGSRAGSTTWPGATAWTGRCSAPRSRPTAPSGSTPTPGSSTSSRRPPLPSGAAPTPLSTRPPWRPTRSRCTACPARNRVIYLDFDGHTSPARRGTATASRPRRRHAVRHRRRTRDVLRRRAGRRQRDLAAGRRGLRAVRRRRDHRRTRASTRSTASSATDQIYGTRVVIDPTTWYQAGCGCGGVAYVGVFDIRPTTATTSRPSSSRSGVGTGAKNIAEAASHEVGHNLGLSHDGTAAVGYYERPRRLGADHGRRLLPAITPVEQGRVRRRQQHRGRLRRHGPERRRRARRRPRHDVSRRHRADAGAPRVNGSRDGRGRRRLPDRPRRRHLHASRRTRPRSAATWTSS